MFGDIFRLVIAARTVAHEDNGVCPISHCADRGSGRMPFSRSICFRKSFDTLTFAACCCAFVMIVPVPMTDFAATLILLGSDGAFGSSLVIASEESALSALYWACPSDQAGHLYR